MLARMNHQKNLNERQENGQESKEAATRLLPTQYCWLLLVDESITDLPLGLEYVEF